MKGIALMAVVALAGPASAQAPLVDSRPIATIDFYGQRTLDAEALRKVLPLHEGDRLSQKEGPTLTPRVKAALSGIPHLTDARVDVVCCAQGGGLHVFVGVREDSSPRLTFRAAPTGAIRLTPELVAHGQAVDKAIMDAVFAGKAAEDDSLGHSLLSQDPEGRALQEQTIPLTARNLDLLRQVLRDSSDGEHRAIAARYLGYAADKQAVVADLVRGLSDPDGGVRNDSMRALMVFSLAKSPPRIPYGPFVDLLDTPVWTDLNKSSAALLMLSGNRDPQLLALLRRRSLPVLIDMARWRDRDHSQPAFWMLGRIGGLPNQAIQDAWNKAQPEIVIAAARKRPR